MSNSKIERSNTTKRTPLHRQKIFGAGERPGFIRRYVNEVPGRIERFKDAGWTLVSNEVESDNRAQTESQLGTVYRKVVNRDPNAPCRTAVLMEIPEKVHKEDFLDKQKENDYIMSSIDPRNKKQDGADYGEISYN